MSFRRRRRHVPPVRPRHRAVREAKGKGGVTDASRGGGGAPGAAPVGEGPVVVLGEGRPAAPELRRKRECCGCDQFG